MAFKKAVREQVWLKIQFGGTSGSGKTTSALRLATGLKNRMGGDIAFISTEKSRTLYNADKFNYDVNELTDYSPESFISAIDEALDAGYKIIIIDSTSHEWQWLNDTHSKMPGNSFQNWGKLKPRHAKLMRKILECPAHVITCARGKTEWAMEEKNGKQTPVKVGLGNEGDKQADFEYTVSFALAQGSHIASVEDGGKDNTGLFMGRYEIITEKDGEMLYDWANASKVPPSTPKPVVTEEDPAADPLKPVLDEVVNLANSLYKTHKEVLDIVKKYAGGNNPRTITDLDKAQALLDELKAIN